MTRSIFALFAALGLGLASAQTPVPPGAPAATTAPEQPHGTVLFERHTGEEPPAKAAKPSAAEEPNLSGSALTDDERSAVSITSYDLDARLRPASSELEMRAQLTVRNDSKTPLTRVALQVSSSLTWQSVTLLDTARTRLPLVQHLLDTDTDHTGKSNELVLTLPQPLAPGKVLVLDTFYSGTVALNGERLERIGATHEQAIAADWDVISPDSIALRGYGNVLWYPVASPQYFLGDGNKLFQAIGQSRLHDEAATVHLRLTIEYRGEPPVSAYFCGGRKVFTVLSDNSDSPVATAGGIATAEFPAEPLGFRPVSLFVLNQAEVLTAPLSGSAGKPAEDLLAVDTTDDGALPRLADSALSIAPLLQTWFGPHPLSALTVLDHEGQPFEDGPLLVAPVAPLGGSDAAAALAHSLTCAWVQTGQPWMDEGLAQFMSLLYTEQQRGRDAATTELDEMMRPVALAEPAPDAFKAGDTGQPIIATGDEIYYRRKAAAVWWMLRSLAGDQPLQIALTTWRSQPISHDSAYDQAVAFEHLLEKTSGKDLAWFFADWVLRDRGLPDLTIVDVTPRQLPAGKGHDSGWLVAVTVRNDGAAAVEVPLVVRAGNFSITRSLRVPGLSSATDRVVVEAKPTQVLVNDGTTPEVRSSQHSVDVTVQTQ